MLVTRENFDRAIEFLKTTEVCAIDTETTGLRPYHGDVLFCFMVTDVVSLKTFYFNFNSYPDIEPLPDEYFGKVQASLFDDPDKVWVIQDAKFDMAILANDNLTLKGEVVCAMVLGRLEFNDHFKYGLGELAKRIGEEKFDMVTEYVKKHKLATTHPHAESGKSTKKLHYELVPLNIMQPYGEQDTVVLAKVFNHLNKSVLDLDRTSPANRPKLYSVVKNEVRLTQTLFRIERRGIKVDPKYCRDAALYYSDQLDSTKKEFKALTGHDFVKGQTLFKEIFKDEDLKYTDKRNPIFDKKALKLFKHPAASIVLDYGQAKSQIEYFKNFLYFMDKDNLIHTDFRQSGTKTGRLSSANPNLQNLTSPDKYDKEDEEPCLFPVRRAFIPRDGKLFGMLDYDQMEFRMLLDVAEAMGLIEKVLSGLDVHQATADVANISRKDAKTVNFATVYGSGIALLAKNLGVSESEARRIRASIFNSAPEIKTLINQLMHIAETRGYIFNWFGRRSYYKDPKTSYKAPNHYIQGGTADVMKIAMNLVDDYQLKVPNFDVALTIHDELVFELDEDKIHHLKQCKNIMENVYPHKRLPLTAGIEHSFKSLADKVEGLPL